MTLTAKWVVGDPPENAEVIGWLGGSTKNPTWQEYVSWFDPEILPILEAIRVAHTSDNLDIYGEDMNLGYFELSDGRVFQCSWRAWGDFRQAMENKREGYMKYYMR